MYDVILKRMWNTQFSRHDIDKTVDRTSGPLSVATPWGDDGDQDVGPGVTGQWHGDMQGYQPWPHLISDPVQWHLWT